MEFARLFLLIAAAAASMREENETSDATGNRNIGKQTNAIQIDPIQHHRCRLNPCR